MLRMNSFLGRAVCAVVVVCASLVSAASADNWIEFFAIKTAEGYEAEIILNVDGVSGAGQVRMHRGDENWEQFDYEDMGQPEYFVEPPSTLTLGGLNSYLMHSYTLEVTTAAGVCTYNFDIGEITDSMFAPLPTFTNPTDGASNVPQDVTLQWTWQEGGGFTYGDVFLWVDVMDNAYNDYFDGSYPGGSLLVTDTSWQPNLINTGPAWAEVGYDVDASAVVSAVTYNAAESTAPDFGWDVSDAWLEAADEIAFTVGLLPGDMNGSNSAAEPNGNDIHPFVLALVDRLSYDAAYPAMDADVAGDIDGNGALDGNDIKPFVDLLVGDSQAIPEPASAALLLLGFSGLLWRRLKR